MVKIKNIFISHIHEDDNLLSKLKNLIEHRGVEIRDSSINTANPNKAQNKDYIRQEILKPHIDWAGALIVLINQDTADSEWVNWEIKYAAEQGKRIVGVFAPGANNADIPEEFETFGDALIAGWQGDRILAAINGENRDWDDPETGEPRSPKWPIERYHC